MTDQRNTPPTPSPEDLHVLAGEYVLGTLAVAERQAVQQRLPGDRALQQAVAEWEARLLPLTQLAEPIAPPAALWERIDQSLQAASLQHAAPPAAEPLRAKAERKPSVRWWDHLGLWRALAGSGFAMAAVLAAVLVTRTAPVAAPPQFMVVLVAPQAGA